MISYFLNTLLKFSTDFYKMNIIHEVESHCSVSFFSFRRPTARQEDHNFESFKRLRHALKFKLIYRVHWTFLITA